MLRLIAFAGAFFATSVCAQATYGFATIAPGTMLHTLGSVIAKAAQDNSKLQLRVQGFGGDAGAIDSVNNKASDFLGLEIGETADAYHGRGNWDGKQRANLRMAMTMFPIMVAPYVRKDSPVQSIAEASQTGPATNITQVEYHRYAVSADGQRFLVPQQSAGGPVVSGSLADLLATAADQGGATGTASNSLMVVLNWTHLLKRK